MAMLHPVRKACPACGKPMKAVSDGASERRSRYVCTNCNDDPLHDPRCSQVGGWSVATSGALGLRCARLVSSMERARSDTVDMAGPRECTARVAPPSSPPAPKRRGHAQPSQSFRKIFRCP